MCTYVLASYQYSHVPRYSKCLGIQYVSKSCAIRYPNDNVRINNNCATNPLVLIKQTIKPVQPGIQTLSNNAHLINFAL